MRSPSGHQRKPSRMIIQKKRSSSNASSTTCALDWRSCWTLVLVYVLHDPPPGRHPADTEALLRALQRLKAAGNSLFVVEHELDVVRQADWIVDVGPEAGEKGGRILYSGPLKGLADIPESQTRRFLFGAEKEP